MHTNQKVKKCQILNDNIIIELSHILETDLKTIISISIENFEYEIYDTKDLLHELNLYSKKVSENVSNDVFQNLDIINDIELGDFLMKKNSVTYIYYDEDEPNVLSGYKLGNENFNKDNKLKIGMKWRINTLPIISITYNELNKNTISYIPSPDKVFYKNLNPNLILILSKSLGEDNVMNCHVSLIDSETGKPVFKLVIDRIMISEKIIPIFVEDKIFISYVRKEKTAFRQELISIELLKKDIDDSIFDLFNDKFKTDSIVIMHQTYTFNKKIKEMIISKTKKAITNKVLLIVYENQLISILDIRNVSARRTNNNPMNIEKSEIINNQVYEDVELPPYNGFINIDYKMLVSRNYLNERVDFISVVETNLESTFLLCTGGIKISCYKTTPDKNFDSLPDNFNYIMIILFIILISVSFI